LILTVTLNPALDRTMIVPNFQTGFRNRATDTIILPGGKGINVARAIKTLGRPVIATGLVGGRRGDQILVDLNGENIPCDFVRIRGESRTTTALVDSSSSTITEINEYGPEVSAEEIGLLYDKVEFLSRAAEVVILAGSLPRGVPDDCFAQMIHRLKSSGTRIFFYTYGEPLRLGIKAGPDYIFPKMIEAEKVIGYEFGGESDRARAAQQLQEMGAGSVVITYRYGCVAVLRENGASRTVVGRMPKVDVVSPLGWGDALAGGYVVRMLDGDAPSESLRFGLGCATANLIRYGAGVFSASDAVEFAKAVELEEVPTGE